MNDEPTVLLLGTFDTKGAEYRFVAARLEEQGCSVLTMDTGVLGDPGEAVDVTASEVAAAAGADREQLRRKRDRGAAVAAMGRGAARLTRELYEEGRIAAVLALGGSGGAAIAAEAMRGLPIGVPKLIVTTLAAGDTRPFIGEADIVLAYPVTDIAGLNRLTRRVLRNAAGAIAGMSRAGAMEIREDQEPSAPLVGATMFGVTTPCVDLARKILAEDGFETLVFNANGTGGRSLERLLAEGELCGALDVTTTELADELVGGILSAGPGRLRDGGRSGAPRVVVPGAMDMVNFGPVETVPERFAERNLYRHNAAVTLMRTTPGECAELGRCLADRLNEGTGPRSVALPLRGVSALSAPGQPFHDPEADEVLFDAIRDGLEPEVEIFEADNEINDPEFAELLAEQFKRQHELAYRTKERIGR
ncbi:MAG TPA: Tm-1-like ATP-binding domain-containing protein [Solirubrobacterales bacterium]|nr:Tm-1-like ATP-binding domain-containing protein [Solirubrobacterales bacterium]